MRPLAAYLPGLPQCVGSGASAHAAHWFCARWTHSEVRGLADWARFLSIQMCRWDGDMGNCAPCGPGGKFGTYGDLISLPLWSADGRAFVLYHVILPLPQAIWMQEYRKAGCHGLREACSYPLSAGRSDALLPAGFIEFLRQNDAAAVLNFFPDENKRHRTGKGFLKQPPSNFKFFPERL